MKYCLLFILFCLSLAQDVKSLATNPTVNVTSSSTKYITTTIVPSTAIPISNSSKVGLRASRPVNGFRVSKIASKFMATIRESPSELYLCSAVFIRKDVLLTTARCLFGRDTENIYVHSNPTNLQTTGSGSVPVKKVYIHPEFDFGPVTSDFSLIILKKPISYITPLSLPNRKIGRPGSVGLLYTWRFTPNTDKFLIHEHKSKIISASKCYLINGEITPEDQACAEGIPFREGTFDHGMPFVIRKNTKNYLFGVSQISRKLVPERVDKIWKIFGILSWIEDILQEGNGKPTLAKASSESSKETADSDDKDKSKEKEKNKEKGKEKNKGKGKSFENDFDDIDDEIDKM